MVHKKTALQAYQKHLLPLTIVVKGGSNKTLLLLECIRFNDAIDPQGLKWHGLYYQMSQDKFSTCANVESLHMSLDVFRYGWKQLETLNLFTVSK